MRDIEEIKKTAGVFIKQEGRDGFGGTVFDTYFKKGKLKVDNDIGKALHFICSWGMGFEHVSVSTPIKTPTWEQMCKIKDIFWRDDEVCMQLHPKKEDYVNMHSYCLHIWKPTEQEIPTPPSIMVGLRRGKEKEDAEQLLEMWEQMPHWKE